MDIYVKYILLPYFLFFLVLKQVLSEALILPASVSNTASDYVIN